MKNALVIIFDDFEEIEAIAPVDILRRASVKTTLAAMGKNKSVVGRSKITVEADTLFSTVENETFDAVILSGGAGVHAVAKDSALLNLLKRHFDEKKIVAAICAAPIALENAGILADKKATAHQSVISLLKNTDPRADVVRDANVITSRGAGTAVAFALEIVSALENAKCAMDIANSICYTPRL